MVYENDEKFVAICPKFFGFVIYAKTQKELEKSVIHCLRVYTKDLSIDGKEVEFVAHQEHEMTM